MRAACWEGTEKTHIIITTNATTATNGFIAAIAKHRHFARETDPPRV